MKDLIAHTVHRNKDLDELKKNKQSLKTTSCLVYFSLLFLFLCRNSKIYICDYMEEILSWSWKEALQACVLLMTGNMQTEYKTVFYSVTHSLNVNEGNHLLTPGKLSHAFISRAKNALVQSVLTLRWTICSSLTNYGNNEMLIWSRCMHE